MFLRRLLLPGGWSIYAICDKAGDAPALNILKVGGPGDANASCKRQMLAHLGHVAQLQHPPRNTTTSHLLDEEYGIWQFIKRPLRLIFFYDAGRTIILSHGFMKDTRKTPPGEIGRARNAVDAYFRAKTEKNLHYVVVVEEEATNG
jgi:phage-related protein